jgi:hypothetical protein
MPVSASSIVQSDKGYISGAPGPASGNATLPNPVATGNSVIVFVFAEGTQPDIPANFTVDQWGGTAYYSYAFRKPDASGESSWALNLPSGGVMLWSAVELHDVVPLYQDASTEVLGTNSATLSTGTTGALGQADALMLTSHALFIGAGLSPSVTTWSGYTNGYTELEQQNPLTGTPSNAHAQAICYKLPTDGAAQECTATRSSTLTGQLGGLIVSYQSATLVDPRGPGVVQVG